MSRIQIHKKSIHRMVSAICGLISVGGLLCIAIFFPGYYCSFHDQNTLNKMVKTDIKIKTYETAYTSFAEKIHALTQAQSSPPNLLRAVRTNEAEPKLGRKELTKIAREELESMKKNHIIPLKLAPKAKKMTFCERYIIYAANERDSMSGIGCWKLVYTTKKRIITIYLDEEYHKIYYLSIQQIDSEKQDADAVVDTSGVKKEKISMAESALTGNPEDQYMWWEGILRYYDLYTNQNFYSLGMTDSWTSGEIGFEDTDNIFIHRFYKYTEDGISLNVGLLLEKMIQF